MAIAELKREPIAKRVASDLESAVSEYADEFAISAAQIGKILGLLTLMLAELPPSEQKRLARKRDRTALAQDLSRAVEATTQPAAGRGAGLGELIDRDEGRRRLAADAITVPLEEWAGKVAGSSQIQRDLGIQRSTLHDWQRRGEIIGLLKGTRNHVFPLAQFLDGRPVRGVGHVAKLARGPRVAWLWLVTPNPHLRDARPIDLLRQDRFEDVEEAARMAFEQQ